MKLQRLKVLRRSALLKQEQDVAVKQCQRIVHQSQVKAQALQSLKEPRKKMRRLLPVHLKPKITVSRFVKRSIDRFFLVLIIGMTSAVAVDAQDTAFHIAFYNVENLFDTIDTPEKNDEEFTPSSKLQHGSKNYKIKIANLAKVINAMSESRNMGILGLCEVENLAVVNDLESKLSYSKYAIIHEESPDERGIDNAILVDKKHFKIIESGKHTVSLGEDERPTRDIIWGRLKHKATKEELLVFVNHWPSRYGGAEASNWKRVKASESLSEIIALLKLRYANAHVVVLGDLNDYPSNESVSRLEQCEETESCLKDLHARFEGTDRGSHAYKGGWGVLDHILVSQSLLKGESDLKTSKESGRIFKKKWMLYESSYDGKLYPSRAYGRDKFYGGYSDHLPVIIGILK